MARVLYAIVYWTLMFPYVGLLMLSAWINKGPSRLLLILITTLAIGVGIGSI